MWKYRKIIQKIRQQEPGAHGFCIMTTHCYIMIAQHWLWESFRMSIFSTVLKHLAYSLDLFPFDFFVSSMIKETLKGHILMTLNTTIWQPFWRLFKTNPKTALKGKRSTVIGTVASQGNYFEVHQSHIQQ